MSLIDDKKSVLNTIGAYTSLNEQGKMPKQNNSFQSVNNKKEIFPYLLDTLKTVAGTEALKQLTGELFVNFIKKTEPTLKTTLKKQFVQYDSDDSLPTSFRNDGIEMPIKDIDTTSKLKLDPNSTSGSLLFDKSKPNFDKTAHDAILNEGTDHSFGGVLINYNSNGDKFKFKPNLNEDPNPTINRWVENYIDNTEIVNQKEIQTLVMNAIYGSLTNAQNKSTEQIKEELEIDKLIENLINDDNSLELSTNDYDDLLNTANNLVNGVVFYDMGCGLMEGNLPLSGLTSLIQQISGSTDSFAVANAIENTINDANLGNSDVVDENKETMRDGFFEKIIKTFIVKISQSLTTAPQIRMLLGITSAFKNNGQVKIGKAKDDLKKFKTIINCIINDLIKLLAEFIFNLVASYLISLLNPIIKKIAKEKINQYKKIIKSLTSTNSTT